MKTIAQYKGRETEVLRELLSLPEVKETPCPQNMTLHGEWKSFIIGIGNDHIAEVLIHTEDYKELFKDAK